MSLFQLGSTVTGQFENVCHRLRQIDWAVYIVVLEADYMIQELLIQRVGSSEDAYLRRNPDNGWFLERGPEDPKDFNLHWKWISVIDDLDDKQLMEVFEELVRAGKQ